MREYNAALARWKDYSEKANEIYREGKDSPAAEAVFKEYTAIAPTLIAELKDYSKADIRIVRAPSPLWWRARTINEKNVVLVQCTDYTDALVTKHGTKLTNALPDHARTPLIINMGKPAGHDWTVYNNGGRDKRSCA